MPIVGIAIAPKTCVVLLGVVADRVDPEDAVVGRVVDDVADQPAPVAKARVHPSRRVVYHGDSVLDAAVFGILQIHFIRNFVQVEFGGWGHVVDDLGTRRAVRVGAGVDSLAGIIALPPPHRQVVGQSVGVLKPAVDNRHLDPLAGRAGRVVFKSADAGQAFADGLLRVGPVGPADKGHTRQLRHRPQRCGRH